MNIPIDDIIKIIAAIIAGAVLGLEREYRDKPAGMRTIMLITVGSALFSLLNLTIHTQSPDRIASTVVTGIGFLGAGVIFKEGLNVKGLTTAATIWVAAAIGMAVGFGNYWLAGVTLLLTLLVLTVLKKLENLIDGSRITKVIRFSFLMTDYSIPELEKEFKKHKARFTQLIICRTDKRIDIDYRLILTQKTCKAFYHFLITTDNIMAFQERA